MTLHEVRIISGGSVDSVAEAAIAEAVAKVLEDEETVRRGTLSDWSRAARIEAVGAATFRTRATLPPA